MSRFTRMLAPASAAVLLLFLSAAAAAAPVPSFEFVSPLPGSTLVLPETNIILRPGGIVDAASAFGGPILYVSGSVSGVHEGQLRLSDDSRTLTFQPYAPFAYGEVVTCRIGTGLVTDTRGLLPPASFRFTLAGPEREGLRDFAADSEEIPPPPPVGAAATPAVILQSPAPVESLPPDFPHIQATVYGKTAPGRLFLSDTHYETPGQIPSHLMILENDGTVFFHRELPGAGIDFKKQPDGRLTYFDSLAKGFYALNARYDVVDSFRCGNGYSTDGHDLVILPNGHAVLMSYDTQIIDMREIAFGGRFNARVIGLILQELDRDKNVVFQWRSWDHFQITDIVSHSLAVSVVDYVHGNSIDVDPDGNLILSSRHMNEVTKISRATGDIIWRLGGKNNQFTFVNEPISFSHQHCVRQLPDGHIIMFDNGNFRAPSFSRAVEYAIDVAQKTATLVWQYRHTPDVFGFATGSVQRLSNGNTLIGWGNTIPTLTEVAADGSIAYELTFDPGIASYRAFRFEWPPGQAGASGNLPMGSTSDSMAVNRNANPAGGRASPLAVRAAFDPSIQRDGAGGPGAASLRLVSAPGAIPVELAVGGDGAQARTFAVYDVRGRLVTRWRTTVGAGRSVTWDGRGSDGRRVSSGIYLVRAESGAPATTLPGTTLKVVIAR